MDEVEQEKDKDEDEDEKEEDSQSGQDVDPIVDQIEVRESGIVNKMILLTYSTAKAITA